MSDFDYAEFDDPSEKPKKKKTDVNSDEYMKAHRAFPKKNVVILLALIAVQVALVLLMIFVHPAPKDRIDFYSVAVTPAADGKLAVTYSLVWTPLDTSEPLTWVTVGVPNHDFQITGFTGAAAYVHNDTEGDYTAVRIDLDRPYRAGEEVTFSFSVLQGGMLTSRGGSYFYEFVPGWFNAVPISHFRFTWTDTEGVTAHNGTVSGNELVWEGDLDCGGYEIMNVTYDGSHFPDTVRTVPYHAFDGDGTENELASDRAAMIVALAFACVVILVFEIMTVDSFVSFSRGRGFIVAYGYPVHLYGRTNPKYQEAAKTHSSSHSGTGHGGGCACACACACAGGGRAGCSQKNTTDFTKRFSK